MWRLSILWETIQAFRKGAPFGDVAALKISAFQSPDQEIQKRLARYSGQASNYTIADLQEHTEGSLGKAYAEHLASNNLDHLVISEAMQQRLADNPYAIRFTQTHDIHHVITGFNTTVAGELGVAAFMAGQNIGPLSPRALHWALPYYLIMAPTQASALISNFRLALKMGAKAKLLIAEPLEEYLELPLEDVRAKVGIEAADIASIQPGGRSWVAESIYRLAGR